MKIVEVSWIDIEELAGGWNDLEELEEHINNVKERTATMVGYLYEEDETQIVLIDSMLGTKFYGTVNVIPKGCIQSLTVVRG